SRILTLVRTGQHAPCHGVLGIQAIIFSPDMNHVLAGIRTKESQYCPSFHAVPGGILETRDTEVSFEDACMREIVEEVDIDLIPEKHLVALISELHGTVGIVAVISGDATGENETNGLIKGNEEWVNSELSWYDVNKLDQCTSENSLEGLLFVKQEREKYIKTGESVLWDCEGA
ncbi:NUDIX domain-containing protein, partial [Candidatus Thorarchaeota archaeon]